MLIASPKGESHGTDMTDGDKAPLNLSQVPLNPLLVLTSTLGPLCARPHPVFGLSSPVW